MLRLLRALPLLAAPLLAAPFLVTPATAETAPTCGGPDTACNIAGGSYHLRLPEGWDGSTPLPALIFFHGHRGSGAGIFRSAGLARSFLDQGYALIGPNGALRADGRTRAWPARPGSGRDDVAFTRAVLEDATSRLPLDLSRIYVSGFSAGGSMAWMVACYDGARYAGFASVAGALRRPVPQETCPAGPLRLIQIHGFADTQVPLEGRGIRDWHQGSVFESFALARKAGQCRSNPDEITVSEPFRCRAWAVSCSERGTALKLCLHDGGHGLPNGWTDLAKDWLEAPLAPAN